MEYIALADQMNACVSLYRTDLPGLEEAAVWSWSPTPEAGFYDCEKFNCCGNVSDIKARKSDCYGGTVMVTCASLGFAAIVRYPSGEPVWSLKDSDLYNPHAIELLPNGNLCVASSQGNSVRVYAASQGIGCRYAEAFLEDAHGLLYDPEREIIWALGGSVLTAYRIGGGVKDPTITELAEKRINVPEKHGHDLQPVYGNHDRLWVTAGGIYQYDKNKADWVSYEGEAQISCKDAKSIGNQPFSGTVFRCVPNGTQQPWNTDTIDIFRRTGRGYEYQSHTFPSSAFYKARIWCENYL